MFKSYVCIGIDILCINQNRMIPSEIRIATVEEHSWFSKNVRTFKLYDEDGYNLWANEDGTDSSPEIKRVVIRYALKMKDLKRDEEFRLSNLEMIKRAKEELAYTENERSKTHGEY